MANILGTSGADRLVGTDDADVLESLAGTDTLSGAGGDDTYRIAGGGAKIIDDVEGSNTLDASGARAAATINLAAGGSSTVIDGGSVTLARQASGGMIDVFLLQDLSGSFRDDLTSVRGLVPNLVSATRATGADVAFGVGAFIDKPTYPFGGAGDYVYQTKMAISTDPSALQSTEDSLSIGGGSDGPEAQLEALLQVAKRASSGEIGFRDGALRTVVLTTDAAFHLAGDGAAAGLTTANNGDATISASEDYPAVAQLRDALSEAGIVPIFAVTSDVMSTYQALVRELGFGTVVALERDSSNLVSAVTSGITSARSSLVDNAIGSAFGDNITGNDAANQLSGLAGSDTLTGLGGNDAIDGGDGTADVAVFRGNLSEYTITSNTVDGRTVYTVADSQSSRDDVDTVVGVEILRFADQNKSLATPVTATPTISDTVGNSKDAAFDFGTLAAGVQRAKSERVGFGSDTADWYKFTLSTSSDMAFRLSGLSGGDADFALYQSNGSSLIAQTATNGSDLDAMNRRLAAGTYYVKVFQDTGSTPYQFALSATPVDAEGSSLSDARNLGTLDGAVLSHSAWVGSTDSADVYKFTLSQTGSIKLALSGLSDDADVQLLDAAGTVLYSADTGGTTGDTVTAPTLAAGTYYARVTADSAGANYTLTVSREDAAGSSLATAKDLGSLSASSIVAADWIGGGDSTDLYKMTLTSAQTVDFAMTDLAADATLSLLDSSGATLVSSTNSGSSDEALSRALAAGSYYLKVEGSTNTSYRLRATGRTFDAGANEINLATDLGRLGGMPLRRNDFVGTGDLNDYYKFSIAGAGQSDVTFRLSDMTGAADLKLYTNDGVLLTSTGSTSGSADDTMTQRLSAGTYRVQVLFDGADTAYSLTMNAARPDLAGSTLTTARTVGALSATAATYTDYVGADDLSDLYKFTLSSTSDIRFTLGGLTADADLQLLDSAGTVITGSNTAGIADDAFARRLTAGTYYLNVGRDVGADTGYTLRIARQVVDNAGNTAADARVLGASVAGSRTFSDFVGSDDTADFYKFSLRSGSDVRLQLTDMTADADVQLLRADGSTVIITSSADGTASDLVNQRLTAGDYYVRVFASGADTAYRLALTTTAADSAGSTLATARDLGRVSTVSVSDFVGTSDTTDLYKFTLASQAQLGFILSNMVADADMALLDSAGTVIVSSDTSGTASDTFNRALTAGTYYLRVAQGSGDTTYALQMTASAVDNAGNTRDAARFIGELQTSAAAFSDAVSNETTSADRDDYYKFTLGTSGQIALRLTGLSANANLELQDSAGVVKYTSTQTGTSAESITQTLAAGTYYVHVEGIAGATSYNLATAFAPVDLAGNTVATARDLGRIGSAASRTTDFVGGSDVDWYKFTLATTSTMQFALRGMSDDADMSLLSSSAVVLATSSSDGTTDDVFNQRLAAGTYYVRVVPAHGDTNYSLSVAAQQVDNAGNSLVEARQLGTLLASNQTFTDFVGGSDSQDFYKFTLGARGTLDVRLDNMLADAEFSLLNSNGDVITATSTSGTVADTLNRTLDAGSYYLRVYQDGGDTSYRFQIKTNPTDTTGNTLAAARSVGNLEPGYTSTFREYVGSADTADVYSFHLTTQGNINLSLTGMTGDAGIELLSSGGMVLMSSDRDGSGLSESLTRSALSAGDYFVRVNSSGAETNYAMGFSVTSTDRGGDDVASAAELGELTSAATDFSDAVGTSDANDWLMFTIDGSKHVSFAVSDLTADVRLLLRKATETGTTLLSSNTLHGSDASSTSTWNPSNTLTSGTYYLNIQANGGNTSYSLLASASSSSLFSIAAA